MSVGVTGRICADGWTDEAVARGGGDGVVAVEVGVCVAGGGAAAAGGGAAGAGVNLVDDGGGA